MTDLKRHSPLLNASPTISFATVTTTDTNSLVMTNTNRSSRITTIESSLQSPKESTSHQFPKNDDDEIYLPNAFYFQRSTSRRPDSADDNGISAPSRSDPTPFPTLYSDTLHDNWVGPFRLPPPPSTVIVNNSIPKATVFTDKKTMRKNPTEMEPIPTTILRMDPARHYNDEDDEEEETGFEMELSFAELDAVEQISEVFPEVSVEIIQAMVRRSSLGTVMNQLAEQSKGAWGEVDSICGIRKSLASTGECGSCSSSIHSDSDDFLNQLDQIMEIFPTVTVNRSEELLKRHSINTVLILLASEERLQG